MTQPEMEALVVRLRIVTGNKYAGTAVVYLWPTMGLERLRK